MRRIKKGGSFLATFEKFGVGLLKANGDHFIPGMEIDDKGFIPAGWLNFSVWNKGRERYASQARNLVVNEGKNNLLNVYFADGTQTASSSWFMGLFSDSGFTGIAAGDTAASHAGWTEFTGYSQSTRPLWGQAGPSTGVTTITNGSPVVFSITSSANIKGGFIITQNTKGGTSGKLWAAALFSAVVPVNNGDELRCTYNLST
jgi:hypothetical protein